MLSGIEISTRKFSWGFLPFLLISDDALSLSAVSLPFGISLGFAPTRFRTRLTNFHAVYSTQKNPFPSETTPRAAHIPHQHPSKQ